MLPDSWHIQESEVDRLNRRNRQRGLPTVEPIYTREIAKSSLKRIKRQDYGAWFEAADGIRARFWNAGHILGSASVELAVADDNGDISILFSGDIGSGDKDFHDLPAGPRGIDFVVMESTYGGRRRPSCSPEARRKILARELGRAIKAGGMILVPAFAVERTQELLFDLDVLFDTRALPSMPIFVDSPLAKRATEVFDKHLKLAHDGTHPFHRPNLRFVANQEDSKKLNQLRGGAIILAGSGMCDAGRIRHHLKAHLGRSDTTVLLAGYQAPGTLGRLLIDGERMVRIHGEEVGVAARIRMLDHYSGHADHAGLVRWLEQRAPVAWDTFLVHGEDDARSALAESLIVAGIDKARIRRPVHGEVVRLSAASGAKTVSVDATVNLAGNVARDWHNTYAKTVIDLRKTLDSMPDDETRRKLLKRMDDALVKSGRKPRR
ncbi:MAG: MBL fold metallo-hydrolase [Alphaproteobacteria bacterium]|nr:MBL fold metallo-hydrolase [Alphaproteobacteria bacterium]